MTKSNTQSKTRRQNGTKNNNTSSQMLLDHCYTFGLLLWPSNSEEEVLLRRDPHRPIMALPFIHHWADLAQKSKQMCRGHENFIPTKFGKYSSSHFLVKADSVFHTYTCTSAPPPPFFILINK